MSNKLPNRVPTYGMSITDGPGWDVTKNFNDSTPFEMTFVKDNGTEIVCQCILDMIGFQDALGNIIPVMPKEGEGARICGRITILGDDKYEAQVRVFEYYNIIKRKGELLDYGAELNLVKK